MQLISILTLLPLVLATPLLEERQGKDTSVSVDNPNTSFLTETNSQGLVTGQPPKATSVGQADSDIGTPSSIPAGMTSGTYTVVVAPGTSVVISADKSTTEYLRTITHEAPSTPSQNPTFTGGNGPPSNNSMTTRSHSGTKTGGTTRHTGAGTHTGGTKTGGEGPSNTRTSSSSTGAAATAGAQLAGGFIGAAGLLAAFL